MPTGRKTSRRTPRSTRRSSASTSIVEPLRDVQRAMKELRARWYVFGAQAVALHGVPRTTQDIDVTLLCEAPPGKIVEALARHGIRTRIDDPTFIAQTRVIPALHRSGWPLDVVLGAAGLEAVIAEDAVTMRVGALRLPVVTIEHLLVLKILAGRPQDLADLASLIGARRSDIDAVSVRRLLGELEEGLGEGGLLEGFERAWKPRR
jgi:hypothetical protein